MSTDLKQEKGEKQVRKPETRETSPADLLTKAPLVGFGDRITYTFMIGKEVGSIHFDRMRGEIFYKGHNLRNMDLSEAQTQVLEKLRQILHDDAEYQRFAEPYGRILDKVILEKSRRF